MIIETKRSLVMLFLFAVGAILFYSLNDSLMLGFLTGMQYRKTRTRRKQPYTADLS